MPRERICIFASAELRSEQWISYEGSRNTSFTCFELLQFGTPSNSNYLTEKPLTGPQAFRAQILM